LAPILAGLLALLLWISLEPILPDALRKFGRRKVALPTAPLTPWEAPKYNRILLPLDHSERDVDAIAHAAALAKGHGSVLDILHVEEGVTSLVYGDMSSTAEVEYGRDYLMAVVEKLKADGIQAELHVAHSKNPREEIVRAAQRLKPDLIVMGAHGHKGLKDLLLGNTINAVRHKLGVPILVVRH
jgi:manganese transport protein